MYILMSTFISDIIFIFENLLIKNFLYKIKNNLKKNYKNDTVL